MPDLGEGKKIVLSKDTEAQSGVTVQLDSTGGMQFGVAGQNVTEISTDGTMVDNVDTVLPTEQAAKTYSDYNLSAGFWSGGALTDNLDGTIDVDAGIGFLRNADTDTAPIGYFTWPADTGIVLVDGSANYIYVDYNGGTPIINTTTTEATVTDNENNLFELYEIFREGTTLHVIEHSHYLNNAIRRIQQRFYDVSKITRAAGLIIDETGTRNITVTAGSLWVKLDKSTQAAIDTSGADTFDRYYTTDSGATWTKQSAQTQWNNTQYNDITSGLVTLTDGYYSNQYFYMEPDGHLLSVYGQNQYTSLRTVQEEDAPSLLPPRVDGHAILIGRVVFQKNDSAAQVVQSVFGIIFRNGQNGIGWGDTRTSGSGVGLTHTISTGAAAGVQAFKVDVPLGMSNALTLLEVDMNTQSLAHTAMKISGGGGSSNKRGLDIDLTTNFAGIGVKIAMNGEGDGVRVNSNSNNSLAIGYQYIGDRSDQAGTAFSSQTSGSNSYAHIPLNLSVSAGSAQTGRVLNPFIMTVTTAVSSGATVITDDYEALNVIRTNRITFSATSQLTSNGAVAQFQNNSTHSDGTLVDNVKVLSLLQDSLSTGVPISVTQDAVVSTNFRKILTEENAGITHWMGDGTDPNGTLSGSAGDVLFNGLNNQPYYCTGTTNWASLIDGIGANTALSNLSAVAINESLISDTDITDDLGSAAIRWNDIYAATLNTGDTATDTLILRARDVDGASWTNFITLTAANIPTCVLSGDITSTTQAPSDNSTKLATTAYVDAAVTIEDIWDRVTGTPNYVIPKTSADDIGATAARITKGWFTDLEVTNSIAGSITGNAATVTTITGLAPDTATTQATQPNITSAAALATVGTITTGVWNGTDIAVADGGTGRGTATAYAVICGGTTSTGPHQSIASVGSVGDRLVSNGAGQLPTFETPVYGEMYFNNNSTAQIMETANTPIGALYFTTGSLSGWSFDAGSTNGITAYADYSGTVAGTVLVTSAGHGLTTGDFISIRGTTNYNGVFQITTVDASNFYITVTWVADDGASDFEQPSYLEYTATATCPCLLRWDVSAQKASGASATVTYVWYKNVTPQVITTVQREFPAADIGAFGGGAIISVSTGDRIFLTISTTNTDDITNNYGSVSIIQI